MKYFKYIFILIGLMSVVSCTKPYSIDINDIERRIVLNSFFCADSTFRINLTEEASLTDNTFQSNGGGFKTIDNSLVIIYKDGQAIDTAYYTQNGNYYSHIKPDFNYNYKIEVQSDKYENIEAEDNIPTIVAIDSISKIKISDDSYSSSYKIKIAFKDPPNEKNCYLITSLKDGSRLITYSTIDPAIGEWSTYERKIAIFNDELFEGGSYEIVFDALIDAQYAEYKEDYIIFNLFSISEEFYLYTKSYNNQQPKFGDDLMEYFQNGLIEPIPIYSNIEGGLGIFAGYAVSQDSVYYDRIFKLSRISIESPY